MPHHFEITQNRAGEFVGRFKYNSETIFWTEGYASRAGAQNAIDSIVRNGPQAEVDDTTLPVSRGHHFEIYQNRAGEYVARFKYNDEILFWTEGYETEAGALNAIASISNNGPSADVEDATLSDLTPPQEFQINVESVDWTGLARKITKSDSVKIRKKAKGLLAAIAQSDADADTKADASKRVEAVISLLEAPNVPWRQVVELLNHPAVTAFLAAVSLLQFIIGMAP